MAATAARVEEVLEMARVTVERVHSAVESDTDSTEVDSWLLEGISRLHDALLIVCDFYNQRITELQDALIAFDEEGH